MQKIYSMEFAGRPLSVETGSVAQLANGSVLVRYGDTVVLSTATASSMPREEIDYFPLSVDYEERLYSVGRIPGGFIKREGRPSEKAVLTSRVIDRPLRPLFPKDMRNDVTVVNTVLSVDQDNTPEITAMIGASTALSISDIPFKGPIGGVMLGFIDGQTILNPNAAQREESRMSVIIAGTGQKITMIEASAYEMSEEQMLVSIQKGFEEIKKLVAFIETIVKEVGKPKFNYTSYEIPADIFDAISNYAADRILGALFNEDKQKREVERIRVTQEIQQHFAEIYPGKKNTITEAINKIERKLVRKYLLEKNERVDGRGLYDIRQMSANVSVLPRTHGSGLFQRGQTQVLTAVTLGALGEVQMLDGVGLETEKRYMHHYNFPAYSVGEARPSRGPGRREIGHGALAEKALEPVLPDEEEFPYAIRLVSEVLMSNGSTSQGSVCGSTLALMDAGVPIKRPVAGISAGLVTDENDSGRHVAFIDIQGIEDFYGDMDFKVAGTDKGITAIQVDIKTDGLDMEIIREAFEITRKGRLEIINEVLLKAIPVPRKELSPYAPKIFTTSVDTDRIRDVIGPGGKVINRIIAETGTKIDIEDDGKVYVAAPDEESAMRAIKMIEGIGRDVQPGQVFLGKVTRIMAFGAFVEYLPGKEGLVHISKLDTKRVEKVEDVVNIGDEITVKVIEIDKQGRINLSRKDALSDAVPQSGD